MQNMQGSNRLAELRAVAGMSQTTLAQQLGVDVSTVSRWENGQAQGGLYKRAPELAQVLSSLLEQIVTVAQLMGWADSDGDQQAA